MFENKGYEGILRELYGLRRLGMRAALAPMRRFLNILGNPQKNYVCIHVAGTNGKGSTVAMTAAILKEGGYRTGAYHSPHVTDYRERFLLDGRFFPKTVVADTLRRMGKTYGSARDRPQGLTFFEWSTALAFQLFADAGVDVAVLETGMGGRFDATSAARPEVAAITNISLEHTNILGKTKRAIAAEKAGIIKTGVPVVCGDRSPDVRKVIRAAARRKRAKAFFIGRDFTIGADGAFTGASGETLLLAPSMRGAYQLNNAAVAAQTALLLSGGADTRVRVSPGGRNRLQTFSITMGHIAHGVANAVLPGRFEICRVRGREVVFDVAHNPDAVRELCKTLRTRHARYDFVVGILSDKDSAKMLKRLAPTARRMYCIAPEDERATPAVELAKTARRCGIKAVALESAKDIPWCGATPLCVTGSFTTVEAVKRALKNYF